MFHRDDGARSVGGSIHNHNACWDNDGGYLFGRAQFYRTDSGGQTTTTRGNTAPILRHRTLRFTSTVEPDWTYHFLLANRDNVFRFACNDSDVTLPGYGSAGLNLFFSTTAGGYNPSGRFHSRRLDRLRRPLMGFLPFR